MEGFDTPTQGRPQGLRFLKSRGLGHLTRWGQELCPVEMPLKRKGIGVASALEGGRPRHQRRRLNVVGDNKGCSGHPRFLPCVCLTSFFFPLPIPLLFLSLIPWVTEDQNGTLRGLRGGRGVTRKEYGFGTGCSG